MRILAVLAIVAATLSLDARDASAEGKYWPFCSRYGWTVVCGYATFQQCLAAVSGAGGFCEPNLVGPPVAVRGPYKRARHARRH